MLRFRDLGASFSRFGCFVLRSSFSSASFSKLPPFVAGILVLLTFIEIMGPFVKRCSRELSSQMAAKILKQERAEKFRF